MHPAPLAIGAPTTGLHQASLAPVETIGGKEVKDDCSDPAVGGAAVQVAVCDTRQEPSNAPGQVILNKVLELFWKNSGKGSF